MKRNQRMKWFLFWGCGVISGSIFVGLFWLPWACIAGGIGIFALILYTIKPELSPFK
ncbi:MAG: hypothetical protein MUP69_05025 [Candidatus Atribacteria bacterium]|nr:hypothetical protein [Candidatus Atribacteria bacterium]